MDEATMDQEREAPLEELEAWGYGADDDDVGAATPTMCAPGRDAPLGPRIR